MHVPVEGTGPPSIAPHFLSHSSNHSVLKILALPRVPWISDSQLQYFALNGLLPFLSSVVISTRSEISSRVPRYFGPTAPPLPL
jgi:hypothetical protein